MYSVAVDAAPMLWNIINGFGHVVEWARNVRTFELVNPSMEGLAALDGIHCA